MADDCISFGLAYIGHFLRCFPTGLTSAVRLGYGCNMLVYSAKLITSKHLLIKEKDILCKKFVFDDMIIYNALRDGFHFKNSNNDGNN